MEVKQDGRRLGINFNHPIRILQFCVPQKYLLISRDSFTSQRCVVTGRVDVYMTLDCSEIFMVTLA